MDPRLLDYYNQELVALRDLGAEFAKAHPKNAHRLVTQRDEAVDPYVERLVESFCFMAARMQVKLDAEFPRFAGRLLEVIYPNYTAPTPSMAVAQFHPDARSDELIRGVTIARGTALEGRVAPGEKTACQFRTGHDVTLYPLAVTRATLAGVPRDIRALDRYVPEHARVREALRLRLRTTNGARIADLRGLGRLPVYLSGDEQVASHLFELLHSASVATLIGAPHDFADGTRPLSVVTSGAIAHEGLRTDQGLLPLTWSKFHGHNLLQEYFACPSRFLFFTLAGLEDALRRIEGDEVEIVVLLNQSSDRLSGLIDASRFALFCSPVINLFPCRTDRIELTHAAAEFHLVPRRLAPLDYEVFAVESLAGHKGNGAAGQEFRPLYQTRNSDEGNYGRYFSLRRESRVTSDAARRNGLRTPYIGSEVYVSLVDQHNAPYDEEIRYLSVDAWLTNRDLPSFVPRDGVNDLFGNPDAPVASIGLIRAPSAPRAPFAERETAWRLVRHLNFNYLPLEEIDHRPGGQGLRDMLRLFVAADDRIHQRQIESLVGVKTRPVSCKLPGKGPLVFGRGIECLLTVDESGFSGVSPYLFGVILEHYLMRHVSINTFTQTELHSMQRGRLIRWPVRMGARGGT
ncbi:Type VI secretion protein [Burkholderia sp. 8Y]|uniref:type VI secretion system baseplate subunit TssF n=1 Tax=Burkholderia sp. 8Y TaxID=2653133 RepID=UPI0012F260C5|nr:type VI secretion system baseplate subunit TssF [Burkholderia sp. 8Y]VXB38817.1 Type VI secretion protein [Burkholderia sp. 8Y]